MKKQNIIPILFILFSIFIIISSTTATVTTTGDIWKIINGNTITQNNTDLNVNIGENTSTSYKLNVEGNVRNNGQLIQTGSIELIQQSIDFMHDLAHLDFLIQNSFGNMYIHSYKFINISSDEDLNINSDEDLNINVKNLSILSDYVMIDNNLEIGNDIHNKGNILTDGQNTAYNYSGYGIIPLGTVISWCNHIGTVVLDIPDGFWVCNGSTINDTASIFDGQPSPNMTNRFIRGMNYSKTNSVYSGNIAGDNSFILNVSQLPIHSHPASLFVAGITQTQGNRLTGTLATLTRLTITMGDDSLPILRTDNEGNGLPFDNQPNYYDMVYLIRIK